MLPVGGIKEKVVAAHRAGIKRLMLPTRNRKDFDDIPEEVRQQLTFVWLERVDEAAASALEAATAAKPALAEAAHGLEGQSAPVALSSECKPHRQPLQPETAGAIMEVTKMAEAFGVAGHE